jgi:hypothetical protein
MDLGLPYSGAHPVDKYRFDDWNLAIACDVGNLIVMRACMMRSV